MVTYWYIDMYSTGIKYCYIVSLVHWCYDSLGVTILLVLPFSWCYDSPGVTK